MVVRIDEQSHGIACVVHVGKKDLDVGAGDECRASSSAGGVPGVLVETGEEETPAAEIAQD